jgi:hypothetical protein
VIAAGEWLASRVPAPPDALARRLEALVGDARVEDVGALAELFVAEAAALIENLGDDRSAAADLLAADSLITYALEAAADDHDRFEAVAEQAMSVIARVAGRGGKA